MADVRCQFLPCQHISLCRNHTGLTYQEVNMVKTAAILFGLVFLLVGILGFVPAATPDTNGMPMLLGIFHVNTVHNFIHLASGVVFLLCGFAGAGPSRT